MSNRLLTILRRYFILGLLLSALASFFYFHLYDYLTLDALRMYQADIQEWKNTHYFQATLIYILGFALLIACAIPCATFLTLLGGFLFSSIAILYATISITLGGAILFLTVRTAIGSRLANNPRGWIKQIEEGFRENAFNYLLTLRLMPIFPCWISNIGAGIFNVSLPTFLTATVIGILPSTIIYALAGRGLDQILTDDQTPVLNILFTPLVFFPLLGLALLSLFPIIYKSVKKRKQNR